jgi:TDG/mug DNA glycosylase family protein
VTRKRGFPPVVDSDVRVLVLGSLPGEVSLAQGRYYGHPRNGFWRLIGAALGEDVAHLDYDARLAALLRRGVGLWDVFAEAERPGSLDAAIRDPSGNDLMALVDTLPRLAAVGFNGATAARIGGKQLAGRTQGLALVALPSSSPAYTAPFAEKAAAWSVLRDYL